jgi:hypothetical protein
MRSVPLIQQKLHHQCQLFSILCMLAFEDG